MPPQPRKPLDHSRPSCPARFRLADCAWRGYRAAAAFFVFIRRTTGALLNSGSGSRSMGMPAFLFAQ